MKSLVKSLHNEIEHLYNEIFITYICCLQKKIKKSHVVVVAGEDKKLYCRDFSLIT